LFHDRTFRSRRNGIVGCEYPNRGLQSD
jgi:hypothetical protein